MSDIHPKKLLILYILDILQKYTDEEHRLSQKEIQDILKKEYEMPVDRKAIKRNLLNLIEYGSSIEYREVSRKEIFRKKSVVSDEDSLDLEDKGIPEDDLLWTDFYLKQKFTNEELRLLIDSLLFSKHIPYSQAKKLITKLESLSNIYFQNLFISLKGSRLYICLVCDVLPIDSAKNTTYISRHIYITKIIHFITL